MSTLTTYRVCARAPVTSDAYLGVAKQLESAYSPAACAAQCAHCPTGRSTSSASATDGLSRADLIRLENKVFVIEILSVQINRNSAPVLTSSDEGFHFIAKVITHLISNSTL